MVEKTAYISNRSQNSEPIYRNFSGKRGKAKNRLRDIGELFQQTQILKTSYDK